ncbi:hypothetical protein ES703_45156 [subsurface metagenome]
MCKLSPTEEKIVANIKHKTRKKLAETLGMETGTLNTHLARIKKKRESAQKLIRRTNTIKKELYPKRKGE